MNDLPSLLNIQSTHLADMLTLLKEEQGLLEQRQALSLPDLLKRKQELANHIQAIDQLIAAQPDIKTALACYQPAVSHLTDQLQACQEQNDINGKLLELNITANRRLAGLLTQLRDRSSLTYDAKGNTRAGTRSRGIKA
ncbi:flagella synthesis protein FlgN [Aeromonas diversa]|uniref:flagella synthesis protein FlgN n=1 Tax=Aeromonas diversa TaxID=502790 RepID=UPI0034635BD5